MLDTLDITKILFLDIETVAQCAVFEDLPLNLQELWAEKTKYQRKNDETPAEFYGRAGIWAEFGKIVCISVGMLKPSGAAWTLRIKSFADEDERSLLQAFTALLQTLSPLNKLCAHNGKEFDFPYLCRRLLLQGLPIPNTLQIAGKKPWEITHLDTLDLWKFGDHKHYTSLALLAAIFGIPCPKDDISGADVNGIYWNTKDLARIAHYCEKDVLTMVQLLLRFKGLPLLSAEHVQKTFNKVVLSPE